jgi:hypothetical protein
MKPELKGRMILCLFLSPEFPKDQLSKMKEEVHKYQECGEVKRKEENLK